MNADYIVIPGTSQRLYDGTVVELFRLPHTKWITHFGYYEYNSRKCNGWYFSSIPSNTVIPVFNEDLVALHIVDRPQPYPPHPPCPPCPPHPPSPVPVIYTPQDKLTVHRSMITVDSLSDRDLLSSDKLQNGKIVRVNDSNGQVEYYEWDAANLRWVEASLGPRYLTKQETLDELSSNVTSVSFEEASGALELSYYSEPSSHVELTGVVHSPVFDAEDLRLRIPIYGKEDLIVNIPKDKYIVSGRYEADYQSSGPAIVFTMSDESEVAIDARPLIVSYVGKDTSSINLVVESTSSEIYANIKISASENNSLSLNEDGLFIDISGKVDKQSIEKGFILVADGDGGFETAYNGVTIRNSGPLIDDTANSADKGSDTVVTANVIAAAIAAAVSETQASIEDEIRSINSEITSINSDIRAINSELGVINSAIDDIESNMVGEGDPGSLVVATSTGVTRSGVIIGDSTLSDDEVNAVASEAAVKDALSWKSFN